MKCGECRGKSPCNKINGSCPDGCSAGYIGSLCSKHCKEPFYGENCALKCSKSCTNQRCHHVTGDCSLDKKSTLSNVEIAGVILIAFIPGSLPFIFLIPNWFYRLRSFTVKFGTVCDSAAGIPVFLFYIKLHQSKPSQPCFIYERVDP
uniref:Uncharacterized protein n=1 Tax=Magallana gigas TaxID=29159 RepID=A0A8W8NY65_MAGGI